MASGVAVVTSNVSSLPEVAGDGAEYADPKSIDSIRSAIEKVLRSPDLRRDLGRRGRAKAENYRWHRSAAQTWDFWNSL
jgi:glycosyltransferase involved in cell wall biosynthesis